MNTKVFIDIQNLPERINGNYIVAIYVSGMKPNIWFYGCYRDLHRAQKAVEENKNAFMVEVVRE